MAGDFLGVRLGLWDLPEIQDHGPGRESGSDLRLAADVGYGSLLGGQR